MSQWKIDPSHSAVHFSVRHMMIAKVRGSFAKFEGALELDDASGAWKGVTADIDVASIDTKEEKRDAHLKSADFLDAATHPKMTFTSTGVDKRGDDRLVVKGNLTLRGVTKEVTLDTEVLGRGKDPWGGERVSFTAKTQINRMDFGAKWNQALEAGGLLVGEKVDIELDVEAIRQA